MDNEQLLKIILERFDNVDNQFTKVSTQFTEVLTRLDRIEENSTE